MLKELRIKNVLVSLLSAYTIYLSCGCSWLVCVLSFCFFYFGSVSLDKKKIRIPLFFSVLTSILWILGNGYRQGNDLAVLVSNNIAIINTLIKVSGYFVISLYFYKLLNYLIEKRDIFNISSKKLFIVFFVLLLVSYIPRMIISFPGYSSPDTWWQIAMYFQYSPWSQHHPVISTYIIGLIIKWASILFNDYNIGFFIVVLLQNIFAIFVLCYGFVFLLKINASKWIVVWYIASCLLSPYYFGFLNLVIKDTFYIFALVLLIIEVCYFLVDSNHFMKWHHCILTIVSVFLVLSFRNDGKFLVYSLFLALLIYAFVKKEIILKTNVIVFIIFALSILLNSFSNVFIINKTNASSNGLSSSISLPLQQTARYLIKHDNDISLDEKEVIGRVLDIEDAKSSYNPLVSDPIKILFNDDATSEEIVEYLQIWFKGLIKDVGVYLDATFNQNYALYYPFAINPQLLYFLEYEGTSSDIICKDLGLHSLPELKEIQSSMLAIDSSLYVIPFINVVSNIPLMVYGALFLLYKTIINKKYSMLVIFAPYLVNILIVIASPVIYGQPRYAFPLVFIWPYLMAMYQLFERNSKCQKEQ